MINHKIVNNHDFFLVKCKIIFIFLYYSDTLSVVVNLLMKRNDFVNNINVKQ